MNKKQTILLMIICGVLVFLSCGFHVTSDMPWIINGNLDLTQWNFQTRGKVKLQGRVKYQEVKRLPLTQDDCLADTTAWPVTDFPGRLPGGKKSGCFRYTFTITVTSPKQKLGVFLKAAWSSYQLYVNGELVMQAGTPSISAGEFIPQMKPTYAMLPESHNNRYRFDWVVANFATGVSRGISTTPLIGISSGIQRYYFLLLFIHIAIMSLLIGLGIHYFFHWLICDRDKRYLYFALVILAVSSRLIVVNHLLVEFLPGSWTVFLTLKKIEYLSSIYAGYFIISYINEFFKIGLKTKKNAFSYIFRGFFIFTILYTIFLLFANINLFFVINRYVFYICYLLTLIFSFYFLYTLIKSKRKYKDYKIFIIGIACFTIFVLYDILITSAIDFNINFSKPDLSSSQFGFFFLAYIVGLILPREMARITEAYRQLSENLEVKVKQKTGELNLANKYLLQKDQEKTHFYQNITHELRTHLSLVMGPLERLNLGACGALSGEQATQAAMAVRNARQLLQLVNQLLDLAKIESGMMQLQTQTTEVIKLLRQSIAGFETLVTTKKLFLTLQSNVTEMKAVLDQEKMKRVITNLISNAVKFTDKGRITITCSANIKQMQDSPGGSESEGVLEIRVKDTGCGIPEEKLSQVFDRYVQGDSSTSRKYSGTGIGLAIVKQYTELHHGEVTVSSGAGKGAEFIIQVPVLFKEQPDILPEMATLMTIAPGETPSSIEPETTESPEPGDDRKPMILIVEDNPDMRLYLKEILNQDYTVHEASNGRLALKKLTDLTPDLIISDLMMPEMDGYTLVKQLRAQPEYALIPVIVITAGEFPSGAMRGIFQQVEEVLTKPVNPPELTLRIRNVLDLHQKRSLIAGKNSEVTQRTNTRGLKTAHPDLPYPVLIVDDDPEILADYKQTLTGFGLSHLLFCQDNREISYILEQQPIALVLLDISMPHRSGLEVLAEIKEKFPMTEVVIISALRDIQVAAKALKQGAYDYLVKPVDIHKLFTIIEHILKTVLLREDILTLRGKDKKKGLKNPAAFSHIITCNRQMLTIFETMEKIADSKEPVLIRGESGTGKDVLPEIIHSISQRKHNIYQVINIAGRDDSLIADDLFGHTKGAFTGADKAREGFVEKAGGGTLFLDELGELSLSSQTKLLRLIENGEYIPIGSEKVKKVDTRIIAATNANLEEKIAAGRFRTDLYYRFPFILELPPLRERTEDLPLLVEYFMQEMSNEYQRKKPTVPHELYTWLETYDFPGNIRELKTMLKNAFLQHKYKVLSIQYFKDYITQKNGGKKVSKPVFMNDFIKNLDILPHIKDVELLLINEALHRAKGAQNIAANLIGMNHSTLSRRIKKGKIK